jgi:transcriptional regulator with GAF, ATPase, and Fis domain
MEGRPHHRGVASADVSVMLLGASGGKNLAARSTKIAAQQGRVRRHQLRRHLENLLEAELFGGERGVPGAVKTTPGKIERPRAALFLDEVGDIPLR